MRQRRSEVAKLEPAIIGYVRVSTEEQAKTGVSLDAQEARIGAYCVAMNLGGISIVSDRGASAKSLERPALRALLAQVRAGDVSTIVVVKLDRLTRSVRDLADLLDLFAKHDVSLVSVSEHLDTGSAAGRLVLNVMGTVSQWEREAIAERTATALAHKRQQRSVYGSTPFGYTRQSGNLVADDREQDALQEAVRLDRAGASFREIAAMLTERGVRPKRGKAWYASSVRAVLRSRIAVESAA
jgi:DNA invertase Pin-like site-specific DNA recombinase